MNKRNRAEGWKHAKRSGHNNEQLVMELFSSEGSFKSDFLKRIGKETTIIKGIDVGGLQEKNVESILGGTTKSKTDLKVLLEDDSLFKISIKKSTGGQVYLITESHFIKGFEKQYSKEIPEDVKRAISLFWGSAEDVLQLIEIYGTNKDYEIRKHRMVAETLKKYNHELYFKLLHWFKENAKEISDFCFSRGLAKDENEWANVIWYINELGENSIDEMFFFDELLNYFQIESASETEYGSVGGGTTIQLPFGFVQWHSPTKKIPGCLQFHHNYYKISKIKIKKS